MLHNNGSLNMIGPGIAIAMMAVPVGMMGLIAFIPKRKRLMRLILFMFTIVFVFAFINQYLRDALGNAKIATATLRELENIAAAITTLTGITHQAPDIGDGLEGINRELRVHSLKEVPTIDGWGFPIITEVHNGTIILWSYGQGGQRQYIVPPMQCYDRARPYQDIIIALPENGMIKYIQVPIISRLPSCKYTPENMPIYFFPLSILLLCFFGFFFWRFILSMRNKGP